MKRLLLAVLALAAGCSPAPAPPVQPASLPAAAPETPRAGSLPSRPAPFGTAPADLRDVRWDHIPLPAPFCGVTGLVAPGDMVQAPSTEYGTVYVYRSVSEIEYADVDGDGRDEALVPLNCHNGGGTAAGQLGSAELVVTARAGRLEAMGTVMPLVNPDNWHVPLVRDIVVRPGRVTVTEAFYREGDANCCPSGTAVTEWTLSDNILAPGKPRITG